MEVHRPHPLTSKRSNSHGSIIWKKGKVSGNTSRLLNAYAVRGAEDELLMDEELSTTTGNQTFRNVVLGR